MFDSTSMLALIILLSADCCLSQQLKVCESLRNWFQVLCQCILAVVLHSAVLCIRLRNILCKWLVTTVLTLPKCPATSQNVARIFSNDSETNSFAYFSSLPRRSNISIRNTLERIHKPYSISENDLKRKITLANNLLRKESKLRISLERFLSFAIEIWSRIPLETKIKRVWHFFRRSIRNKKYV